MNLFNRVRFALKAFTESRSLENPAVSFTEKSIWSELFTIGVSGMTVNQNTALNLSAVYAANKILSEDVAALPAKVYTRSGKNLSVADNHPVHNLLHFQPNQLMTPFTFFETLQTYLDLWGNAYAKIKRDSNNIPVELIIIHPDEVKPKISSTGRLWYNIKGEKTATNESNMLHFVAFLDPGDHYRGLSPIMQAKEVIGNGLAMQEFSNKFFGSGANMSGILSTDQTMTPEAVDRLKKSFDLKYSGIDKSHKTVVLEQGLKYQRIGIEPEAAQFLQSRRFGIEEIARWYRIPPHMLADLERATFSNIEHQTMAYVRQTLVPWLVRYEQEFNRKLFSPSERNSFFVKFNVEGLLRGDSQTRVENYSKLFNIGAISQNEIREKENMNPIEGGDKYYVPVNMMDANSGGQDNGEGDTDISDGE